METVTFNGESVIGQSAFYGCPSLESVAFKKKTMLSEAAFGCTEEKQNSAMTELVLPSDSTIKDHAFSNYSKLNKVTINKGAKLGTKILPGCSALETFIFEADTPQDFESLTFTNFEPENITIYVPDVEKYKEIDINFLTCLLREEKILFSKGFFYLCGYSRTHKAHKVQGTIKFLLCPSMLS